MADLSEMKGDTHDWESLFLPTPETLSDLLYTGEIVEIDGHVLQYENNYVWMDNPYGVEGGLGIEPTIDLCTKFLKRLAEGGMFGPEL
tara:strand:+ start:2745 stop:3008 length:264 start_codon:yes stop_codon:yes gene_type:complete